MSRHNRRRTRGGQRISAMLGHQIRFDMAPEQKSMEPPEPALISSISNSKRQNTLTARHWHNRYNAWQIRERKQGEESEKLQAEKRRIFGDGTGDGEDEVLCVKMLEYFGGLDFIEE